MLGSIGWHVRAFLSRNTLLPIEYCRDLVFIDKSVNNWAVKTKRHRSKQNMYNVLGKLSLLM